MSLKPRVVLGLVLEFAATFGVYWIFVGSLNVAEIVLGVAVALLATIASAMVGSKLGARFLADARSLAQAAWLPLLIVQGTARVLATLAKDLFTVYKARSLLRAVRFDACGDDPSSSTKRALATAYITVSPDTVVVDIDRARGLLVFHQMAPTRVAKMAEKLGAKP